MGHRLFYISLIAGAAAVAVALSACSTVSSIKGPEDGASTEKEARNMRPDDPLARPTQVAWTSARATRCGFIFNPQQLRSNYLNSETAYGHSPQQMAKIEKAYDYTRESVLLGIQDDPRYCNKERLDAIRHDLNRYLAGNYAATARMAR
jgi:hypothetical protein